MSRCETHCPTPSSVAGWITALLAIAAAAVYLYLRISEWVEDNIRPVVFVATGVLATAAVLTALTVAIVNAIRSTPRQVTRPRRSELTPAIAPSVQPPAELEPATYPPLRAVPDLDQERAA